MHQEIKHIRIDGRLIHGQVVTKWIFVTKVDRIIVVDDEILNNPLEKNALKMSTPSNVKLSILGVESAVRNINNRKYKDQKVMVLTKTPRQLRMLAENGLEMKKINVGNISQREGSIQVRPSVFLKEEDIVDLSTLIKMGVDVTTQMVPADLEEKMENILEKIKG
ncbi:PTS sugar transporter subunit IIB [Cetobacterium somerae]|uniref:PTS sugar transporter subunit IIB n=1 Tax=Cetobacterium somerae TaxID=188913 RepID=UPI00225A79F1|nr:PTS sugar transporter subunit IIB [Cetobacterium somerae]MCX3066654.1 PTS sugar transporter subunit IIB [Cetobacterium somerae]